jgi:hypothetical protein
MIGVWSVYSAAYLYGISVAILVLFALPLLFVPLTWARLFKWQVPEHDHLAIYFGRCLGGVTTVLGVVAIMVAQEPALQPFFFRLMIMVFGVMTIIHVYGAWRRIQPLTETVEIIFWAGLVMLTLCFAPATH